MARHRIDHPADDNLHACVGHDHAVGFFAEVFKGRRDKPIACIDLLSVGEPATVQQCLDLLMEHEFFSRADLETALVAIQDGTRIRSSKLAKVVEVVVAMKSE